MKLLWSILTLLSVNTSSSGGGGVLLSEGEEEGLTVRKRRMFLHCLVWLRAWTDASCRCVVVFIVTDEDEERLWFLHQSGASHSSQDLTDLSCIHIKENVTLNLKGCNVDISCCCPDSPLQRTSQWNLSWCTWTHHLSLPVCFLFRNQSRLSCDAVTVSHLPKHAPHFSFLTFSFKRWCK